MKLSLALAFFAFSHFTAAQYFSEGWKPGQAVTKSSAGFTFQTASAPESTPTSEGKAPFDFSSLLEAGPLKSLFQRAGVNISERLEAARQSVRIWDERIPLITDDNYNELIVNEKFETPEEEKKRAWFLVISVTRADKEGVSRLVDERFDSIFDLEQQKKELPHIRWGRLDYLNVTAITTKWVVWRAPMLVILQDRGQTLRFFKPHQIPMNEEMLHEYLKQGAYEHTLPWNSMYGPGGSREFVMEYLAIALTKIYNVFILVPRWLLVILTGAFASTVINLLHSTKKPAKPKNPAKADIKNAQDGPQKTAPTPSTTATTPTNKNTAKGNSNQSTRKRGKK